MMLNIQENGKWGYYNTNTNKTIPCRFYEAADFESEQAIVKLNSSSEIGVIDENGNEVIPLRFSNVEKCDNNLYKVGAYGINCLYDCKGNIVDENGKLLPEHFQKFDIVTKVAEDEIYLTQTLDEKRHYSIYHNDVLILEFDGSLSLDSISDGYIVLKGETGSYYNKKNNCFLYDFQGALVMSGYEKIKILSKNYVSFYSKGHYGIADTKGNILLKANYKNIELTNNSILDLTYQEDPESEVRIVAFDARHKLFVVNSGEKKIKVPYNFDWCGDFYCGIAIVAINQKFSAIDSNFNMLIPCEYKDIKRCSHKDSLIVKKEKKWQVINFIDNCSSKEYDSISDFTGDFCICRLEEMFTPDKYGILNNKGEIVLPARYGKMINCLPNGNFEVSQFRNYTNNVIFNNQAQILINTRFGQYALSPKIVWIHEFSEGLALVENEKGLKGFVNEMGSLVIPCKFHGELSKFENGLSEIKIQYYKNGNTEIRTSHLNKKGNFIVRKNSELVEMNVNYRIVLDTVCDAFIVCEENEWGLIDIEGKPLTSLVYKTIEYIKDGFFKVKEEEGQNDHSCGIIDFKGKQIVPCEYLNVVLLEDGTFEAVLPQYLTKEKECSKRFNRCGKEISSDINKLKILSDKYESVKFICGDFYIVKDKETRKYGVLNNRFQIIIPINYQNISWIIDNTSIDSLYGGYFSANKTHTILGCEHCAEYFNIKGQRIIPDSKNRIIIDKEFGETAEEFHSDMCAISNLEGMWGFINKAGEVVISCQFPEVYTFHGNYCLVSKDFQIGIIDKLGNFVIPYRNYTNIKINENSTFCIEHYDVFNDYKCTDVDEDGHSYIKHESYPAQCLFNQEGRIIKKLYGEQVLLPKEYDFADNNFVEGFVSVLKNGRWGVLDSRLNLIFDCIYDERIIFNDGFAITRKGDFKCVLDTFGNEIVPGKYDHIKHYKKLKLFACLSKQLKSFDFYRENGEFLCKSSEIKSRIALDKDIMSNEKKSPFWISPIDENFLIFGIFMSFNGKRHEKVGLCDIHGNVIIEAKYDDISSVGSGLITVARISSNSVKLWGFVNMKGEQIIDYKYYDAKAFSHGIARVKYRNNDNTMTNWGLVSSTGIELTDFIYDEISDFNNGVLKVSQEYPKRENELTDQGEIYYEFDVDYWGVSQKVCLKGYDWCKIGSSSCVVYKGKKKGIITINGHLSYPLTEMGSIDISIEKNGKLFFKKDDKTLEINEKGQIKTILNSNIVWLPQGIHWCEGWNNGYCVVESNGCFGLIDKDLNFQLRTEYERVKYLGELKAFCSSKVNGKEEHYIYNIKTKEFKKLNYIQFSEFENGFCIVSITDKKNVCLYGVIDRNGNEVVPCKYDDIVFKVPQKENYYNSNYYYDDYSIRDSMMDAFDGCPDAYWNID